MADHHTPNIQKSSKISTSTIPAQRSAKLTDFKLYGPSNPVSTEAISRAGTNKSESSNTKVENHKKDKRVKPAAAGDGDSLERAVCDMLDARKYLLESEKDGLLSFLLRHVTATQILNERNTALLKASVGKDSTVLDFRTLHEWLNMSSSGKSSITATCSSDSSQDLIHIHPSDPLLADELNSSSKQQVPTPETTVLASVFRPPDEFEWPSNDKVGKILTMRDACEIFSIIQSSGCSSKLTSLYLTGQRQLFYDSPPSSLQIIQDTLSGLRNLSILVLRGMCDNDMLKIIGTSCKNLTHLDVSGSQFVNDIGIQNLFYKAGNHPSSTALYLIGAWVAKNVEKMNSLIHTLVHLDYSWTSVTTLGRNMVQLLAGSFSFKRLLSKDEKHAFGHHIFIKEPASLQELIPVKADESQCQLFEKHLCEIVGAKGGKSFLTMIEHHPWRNCWLTLYNNTTTLRNADEDGNNILSVNAELVGLPCKSCYGVITPNEREKRIQGIVHWCNGILSQLYTIYPVNINTLGLLSQLRLFRGIVNDAWRMQSSLLPFITQMDVLGEPITLMNILQCCPNLCQLRACVQCYPLVDDEMIKSIQNSMCRRTLEKFWIAPGAPLESDHRKSKSSARTETLRQSRAIFSKAAKVGAPASFLNKLNELKTFENRLVGPAQGGLVQLSLASVEAMVTSCPKLKKLGDVSLWEDIGAEELCTCCEGLTNGGFNVSIMWANINLLDYANRKSSAGTRERPN